MIRLLIVWVLNAVALMAVAYLMPSITVTNFFSALMAAFALGFVNTLIRPLLTLLTYPLRKEVIRFCASPIRYTASGSGSGLRPRMMLDLLAP